MEEEKKILIVLKQIIKTLKNDGQIVSAKYCQKAYDYINRQLDLRVIPEIAGVIKAINDEPEFTDEMPEDMVEALKEKNIDPDLIKFMLQWAVRLTKENIIKRIESNFSE